MRRRPLRDWARAAEALATVTGASLLIAAMPARHALRSGALGGGTSSDSARARRVVAMVEAVARRLPWRTVCFQKGLAAQWMLRRRGFPAQLRYGARPDAAKGLAAHVWVSVNEEVVIGGGEQLSRFALLLTVPGPRS